MPWCETGHYLPQIYDTCSTCGKSHTTRCANGHAIRRNPPARPAHCHVCGVPYTWTQNAPPAPGR